MIRPILISILISATIIAACSQKTGQTPSQSADFASLTRVYHSRTPSRLEQLAFSLKHIITPINCSLELNADSSCVYTLCGQTETGNWMFDSINDLVVLRVDSVDYLNDLYDSLHSQKGFKTMHRKLSIMQNGNLIQFDTLKASGISGMNFKWSQIEFVPEQNAR